MRISDWSSDVCSSDLVIGRPTGILMGLDLPLNPFSLHPGFEAIADLPLKEKLAILRDPQTRARILSETPSDPTHPIQQFLTAFHLMFPLGNPPSYEPAPADSVAARAEAAGLTSQEIAYDLMLEDDG